MKALYTVMIMSLVYVQLHAQRAPQNLFNEKVMLNQNMEIPTRSAAYFDFDIDSFSEEVKSANGLEASVVLLPLPDGKFEEFEIKASQVMSAKLAAKFPNIKTYVGVSKSKANLSVRFDISPHGFHAMLFTPNGTAYIDPVNRKNKRDYQSYYKKDFLPGHKDVFQEKELLINDPTLATQINLAIPRSSARPSGSVLRTYRLAIAATGEYTDFHGGTVEGALSAIVTTMNRVNGIYEREVAVRMVLVDNTDELIFTNASTDGFSNNDAEALIDEVQLKIDDIIGDTNYDIGHGVSTGGGGLAGVGPCISGRKASGITGSSQPIGDPYDVDYVAHEIGHQFGAAHTFNGSSDNCEANRSSSSAYEPGSGTTIMAYAGICSGQNIQSNSDAYFHTQSYDQIIAYTTINQGNDCAVVTETSNQAPTVIAGESGFTIPVNTAFRLNGSATDPDNDALTYSWEQFDLGPAGAPDLPTGNAPLFRSFPPVDDSFRNFPQISDLVNNTSTSGEILPSYSRDMNFRLTARDNKVGGGGVNYDQMSFQVTDIAGPFEVSSPNTNVTIQALTAHTVTWDVANTNVAPVNCLNVNVLLSTDGGLTFPITLVSNTDNDGEVTVLMPSVASAQARIKVEAADNIFFDISNVDFNIVAPSTDGFSLFIEDQNPIYCAPNDGSIQIVVSELGTFTTPVNLSVSGLPAGFNVSFDTNPVLPGNTAILTISNTSAQAGIFAIEVVGEAGGITHRQSLNLTIFDGAPAPVILQSPLDATTDISLYPLLTWEAIEGVDSYTVQLSSDINFVDIIEEHLVFNEIKYAVVNQLATGSQYFWRVRATNLCGSGQFSQANSFITFEAACQSTAYDGSPIQISSTGISTITSTIDILTNGTIYDVNVKDLNGTHTYIEDLIVTLISPAGTEVKLFTEICGANNDFYLTLDDAAEVSTIQCPPTDRGVYKPQESLTAFNQEQSQGIWTLRIEDTFDQDGGQLDGWTLEVCTENTAENAPTAFVATVNSAAEIQLTWIDNALNETGYRIYRSKADGEFVELVSLAMDTESYQDTGLDPNTLYKYRLSAYNSMGNSEFAIAEAVTDNATPLAPADLVATVNSASEIQLDWVDVLNETGYRIFRSKANSEFIELATLTLDSESYLDTSLDANTLYTYRLFAYNSNGDSEFALVEAITLNTAPLTPLNLVANNTTTQIVLGWEDLADNEAEYIIERSVGDNLNYVEISAVSSDVSSYVDTDVEYGVLYAYRVYATNNGGNSDYSNEVLSGLVTGLASEEWRNRVNISPNPTHGIFHLHIENENMDTYDIHVTNIVGKIIQQLSLKKSSETLDYSFDLSDQSKGIYLVRISSKNGLITQRIVKY